MQTIEVGGRIWLELSVGVATGEVAFLLRSHQIKMARLLSPFCELVVEVPTPVSSSKQVVGASDHPVSDVVDPIHVVSPS